MDKSKHEAASFIVPVGTEEVHLQIGLRPLSDKADPNDPIVLNLVGQIQDAVHTDKNSLMNVEHREDSESRCLDSCSHISAET